MNANPRSRPGRWPSVGLKPVVVATFMFLPAVLLVGLTLVVSATRESERLQQRAIDADDTKDRLNYVLSLLVDVEAGQRGYVATGQREFLQPYDEALGELPGAMVRVRTGKLMRSRHPDELAAVEHLLTRKLALASQSIAAKQAHVDLPASLDRELQGKQEMDAIRRSVAKVGREEIADLKRDRLRSAQMNARAETVFAGLFAALCALMVASYLAASAVLRSRKRIAEEALLRSEAAERANRAKSAFLAMMSHELRTPMNGVLGMAHILSRSRLTRDQREKLDVILTSGKGLMALLNDILDLSKIEAGKMDVEQIGFDLPKLLQSQMELWGEIARAKDLPLVLEAADDLPRFVEGDPTRVRQIINNLLSNALKFTAHGEVRLSVVRQDAQRIAFTVSDTGQGIAPDAQAKLFQPFEQEDQTTTRKFGGTGLGLAICHRLAVLMSGELKLARSDGSGSAFQLTLPLAEAAPILEEVAPDAQAAPARALRVLVAEDNLQNQAVIRAFLAAAGAEGEVVENGALAVEALRRSAFDLILLDVHMPVMDGLEAVAAIRAQSLDGGAPVVALTADAMAGDRERQLAAGFDDHLGKPIDPTLFMGLLGRVASGQVRRAGPAGTAAAGSAAAAA